MISDVGAGPIRGGHGNDLHVCTLAPEECITQIHICCGEHDGKDKVVKYLNFVKSDGSAFTCGAPPQDPSSIRYYGLNGKKSLVGIFGRSSTYLDAVGFYWGPVGVHC